MVRARKKVDLNSDGLIESIRLVAADRRDSLHMMSRYYSKEVSSLDPKNFGSQLRRLLVDGAP